MKYNIHFFLALLAMSFMTACVQDAGDELVDYNAETTGVRNDAQILVYTPSVSFVAGTEKYDVEFSVAEANSGPTVGAINVYKVFKDAATGGVSTEVLHKTYSMNGKQTTFTDSYTFAGLRDGLTVDGAALTENELDIPIGSKWDMRVELAAGDGAVIPARGGASTISVAVLSPFAGTYEVIESGYFRIGVESSLTNWAGQKVFIGSVDANTFSHNGFWGPFAAEGAFEFDLNDDNTITIPDVPAQLFFSGDDMLTCQEDSGSFVSVPCEGSNILVPDPVNGEHVIRLTYGYYTASGDENEGAREFYEVMRKID